MALDTVKKRIEEELQRQAADLKKNTIDEMRQIDEATRKTIMEGSEKYKEKTEAILSRMETRERLNTQMIAKKILLSAKRDALHEVFSEARKQLRADEKRYRQFLEKELVQALSLSDVESVFCAAGDAELIRGIIKEMGINNLRVEEGKVNSIQDGFIAANRQGTVTFDATLKTVFEQLHHRYMQEVAAILWRDDERNHGLKKQEGNEDEEGQNEFRIVHEVDELVGS